MRARVPRVTLACVCCGKAFNVRPSKLKHGAKTCSVSCRLENLHRANRAVGPKVKKRKSTVLQNAHSDVHRAVERGVLVRPTSCEKCGRAVSLHAHHEDYTKPLDVQWLCRSCHLRRHSQLARENKQPVGFVQSLPIESVQYSTPRP